MDLQTKPIKATGTEYDGTINGAIALMSWIQSAGFQFSSQAMSMNQQTGTWVVAITYFKPKPEGTAGNAYQTINISKGIVVITENAPDIKQYATKEALSADFNVVEST
jgi:hypothetical protein